jgi:hypothetical protein
MGDRPDAEHSRPGRRGWSSPWEGRYNRGTPGRRQKIAGFWGTGGIATHAMMPNVATFCGGRRRAGAASGLTVATNRQPGGRLPGLPVQHAAQRAAPTPTSSPGPKCGFEDQLGSQRDLRRPGNLAWLQRRADPFVARLAGSISDPTRGSTRAWRTETACAAAGPGPTWFCWFAIVTEEVGYASAYAPRRYPQAVAPRELGRPSRRASGTSSCSALSSSPAMSMSSIIPGCGPISTWAT